MLNNIWNTTLPLADPRGGGGAADQNFLISCSFSENLKMLAPLLRKSWIHSRLHKLYISFARAHIGLLLRIHYWIHWRSKFVWTTKKKTNLYKDVDFLLSCESVLLFEDATGKFYLRWKTPHQSTSNNPPTIDGITCECLSETNVSLGFLSAKVPTYFRHYRNM